MIITLCSTNIVWENKGENFKQLDSLLSALNYKSDLIILPEMFSTGFTMNTSLAEDFNGESLAWLQSAAKKHECAIVATLPFVEKGTLGERFYNRAFFVFPNGTYQYYDKRHLFRMAKERESYSAGDKQCIVEYLGVNFAINICYDLRFPVWSRNVNNGYDVLLNMANFPIARLGVIELLSRARAIENMAYVAFVNRVGRDIECEYAPSSYFINYKGEIAGEEIKVKGFEELQIIKGEIEIDKLKGFREKFPAWMDADEFNIVTNK